jgi:pimeloyl-ACP methyl ester carboxylesterase
MYGAQRMMPALALSGWGQPHDALHGIVPHAVHMDYARHACLDDVFDELCGLRHQSECAVGWSMGGHVLVQAIASGVIAPKRLVLLATPFQFVQRASLALGMKRETYALYVGNFLRDPHRTFHKSYALIAHGDMHAHAVRYALERARARLDESHDWRRWLEILAASSCEEVDFRAFSPTLLMHGEEDAVVHVTQIHAFAARMPDVQGFIIQGCGHAPHWHAPKHMTEMIETFCA